MKAKPSIRTTLSAVAVAILGLSAAPAPSVAGGIPVFDGAQAAANAQQLAQMIQQVAHAAEQIQNQIQQIQQLKAQVEALTGNRNMGNLARDIALDNIPEEWKSVYDSVKDIDFKKLIDPKGFDAATSLKQLATNYDESLKAFTDTKKRLDRIGVLIQEIDKTKDMKAAADLQNRIAAEQALIQNNQTKLDMMARLAEQEREIQNQKRIALRHCQLRSNTIKESENCR